MKTLKEYGTDFGILADLDVDKEHDDIKECLENPEIFKAFLEVVNTITFPKYQNFIDISVYTAEKEKFIFDTLDALIFDTQGFKKVMKILEKHGYSFVDLTEMYESPEGLDKILNDPETLKNILDMRSSFETKEEARKQAEKEIPIGDVITDNEKTELLNRRQAREEEIIKSRTLIEKTIIRDWAEGKDSYLKIIPGEIEKVEIQKSLKREKAKVSPKKNNK